MSDIQEAILLGAKEIHNLREQNKELQKRLDFMIEQNDEKEDRIDKAIKYINERKNLNWYADGVFVEELLDILKGDNK